jgi:transposase
MKKLIVTHPEIDLDRLTKELSKTKERRKTLRILSLIKLIEGERQKDIARFLKCHRNTLQGTVRKINQEGLGGLEEKEGRGLKGKLTLKIKTQLKNDLSFSPQSLGYSTNLWTGKVLQEHLRKKYHLKYQKSAIYELFHQLGFSLQRPTRKLIGAEKSKQKKFSSTLKKNQKRNEK